MNCYICSKPLVRKNQKFCSARCHHVNESRKAQVDTPLDLAIKSGKSAVAIATEFGITYAAVYSRARYRGLTVTPSPRVYRKDPKPPAAPSDHEYAIALHKAGKSPLVISGLTGLSRSVLSALLGTARPPGDYGGEGRGQSRSRDPNRHVTPAMWGRGDLNYGPIVKRIYRIVVGGIAQETEAGTLIKGGKIVRQTSNFGLAMRLCTDGFVIDSNGIALSKAVGKTRKKAIQWQL